MLTHWPLWDRAVISHDDVTKCKHFPRYQPFVRGIHRFPVNSPHKGQWRWALMFSLIFDWINSWAKHQSSASLAFVRGIHRGPVNSPHKGQWRWALMFSLIFDWINSWANNREAGNLRHHRAHYDVIVMKFVIFQLISRMDRYLEHVIWNCPPVDAVKPHWWLVNIGLGTGLMFSLLLAKACEVQ